MENNIITNKKKHYTYIDIAKVIGIILVTYAHIKERGHDIAFIYSFHLPMFFVIAGITLSVKSEPGDFIMKKIRGYLIPLVFCEILAFTVDISFMIALGQGSNITPTTFFNFIGDIFNQQRLYPLWFVAALFIAVILSYFIVRACKEKIWLVAIASALVLAFAICFNFYASRWLSFNADVSFFGIFFILIGYMFKRLEDKIHFFLKNRWISLIFAIVFIAIGMGLTAIDKYQFDLYLEMWGCQYKEYYLVIPSAVFNSIGFILLSNTIATPYIGQFAKANLVIIALQQGLGMRLWHDHILRDFHIDIVNKGYPIPENLLYALTGTVFTLIISFAIYTAIMFTPLAYALNQQPLYKTIKEKKFHVNY